MLHFTRTCITYRAARSGGQRDAIISARHVRYISSNESEFDCRDGNNLDRCVMWVNSFGIYDVLYSTSQSTVMSYAVESGC